MRSIVDVGKDVGLGAGDLELYGKYAAKIPLESLKGRDRKGKLILITAMTPTPFGEGKTTTAIGLSMAFKRLGVNSIVCVRQPSLGPVFGVKGGATGGGASQVVPAADINLHFTGDIDAVSSAHNLLSAMIDNHIFQGNTLGIDPAKITWPRTVDMNDRALRSIMVAQGSNTLRQDRFVITAASEVMAILALSLDYVALKEKLGRIVIGLSKTEKPVTADSLHAAGAMSALLSNALKPNLVQTLEESPALVHGGPFGNIAHGTCSLLSILSALSLADYAVVECGFASDLGAEKFFNIVCRLGALTVDAVVIVATIRALKHHGGVSKEKIDEPDAASVEKGLPNLAKHIENMKKFGLRPIVVLNRFSKDNQEEVRTVINFCESQGVEISTSTVFEEGGKGAVELAQTVIASAKRPAKNKLLYESSWPVKQKIETIVREIYGGNGVKYTEQAEQDLKLLNEFGFNNLPICVAKTQLSLSDNPKLLGRPTGFDVSVGRAIASAGAGFNVIHMGDIMTMPGLPKQPAAERVDIDELGHVHGLT
jgi:formate--tetrahydrofolate ligase